MFKLRQVGNTYEILFSYVTIGPTQYPVTDVVLLTTDMPDEANSVLSTLNTKGIDALKDVAKEAGKSFYRTNIPQRNSAIARRHFVGGESIVSLAKRFRLHQSTIRSVLEEQRRFYAPAWMGQTNAL